MDTERYRLPGYLPPVNPNEPDGPLGSGRDDPGAAANGRRARNVGIRRVRRMSNWTAAALLVGTGATTVALATHAFPVGSTASGSATYTTTAAGAHGTSAPHVGGTVVTSGGSGATVTTTTHVVNGKTIVTQVKHPAAYHDN